MCKKIRYVYNVYSLLTLIHFAYISDGSLGGHNIYASISSLESIWYGEKKVVNSINKIVKTWNEPPSSFIR